MLQVDRKSNKEAASTIEYSVPPLFAVLRVLGGLLYDFFPALNKVKIFLDWSTAVGS